MGLNLQGLPLHWQSSAPQPGVVALFLGVENGTSVVVEGLKLIVEFVMTVCVVSMVCRTVEVDMFRTAVGMYVVLLVDIWSVV